eukprot:2204432-Prymnesium_polylepis.1
MIRSRGSRHDDVTRLSREGAYAICPRRPQAPGWLTWVASWTDWPPNTFEEAVFDLRCGREAGRFLSLYGRY